MGTMATDSNEDGRAKLIYEAIVRTMAEGGMMGILAAAGDAQKKIPWDKARPKTRDLFRTINMNLTDLERKR
jgi:hypothetical protein